MKHIPSIKNGNKLRVELCKRTEEVYDELKLILHDAVEHEVDSAFTERLEHTIYHMPAILYGLKMLQRLREGSPTGKYKSKKEIIKELTKARKPVPFWYIQWHLRNSMYDTCERCMSNDIAYFKQRERKCLRCGHEYNLKTTIIQWKKDLFKKKTMLGLREGSYTKYQKKKGMPRCIVKGCNREALSKTHNRCARHYEQYKLNIGQTIHPHGDNMLCSSKRCPEKAGDSGYCAHHRTYRQNIE